MNPVKPLPPGVPLLGQPFVIEAISVPVNARLRCNCGGPDVLITVVASAPAPCPSCRRVYFITLNPTNQRIEAQIGQVAAQEAS